MVVLFHTGFDAAAASNAARDIEPIAKEHTVHRAGGLDGDGLVVLLRVFSFESLEK